MNEVQNCFLQVAIFLHRLKEKVEGFIKFAECNLYILILILVVQTKKPYIKILGSSYRRYTIHLETGIVQDEEFKFAVEKKT